jgi:hypothetical protein
VLTMANFGTLAAWDGQLEGRSAERGVQIPFRAAAEPCDLPGVAPPRWPGSGNRRSRRPWRCRPRPRLRPGHVQIAQYGQVAERFSRGRGDQCLGDSRSKVMVLSWVISRREYIPPMRPVPLRVPVKPPAGVWGCQ